MSNAASRDAAPAECIDLLHSPHQPSLTTLPLQTCKPVLHRTPATGMCFASQCGLRETLSRGQISCTMLVVDSQRDRRVPTKTV